MKFFATALSAISLGAVAVSAAPIEKRHSAVATYFYQGGNPGSCGVTHSDSDYVVAIPASYHNPDNCFKKIQISHNGKTIEATIADTCPTCPGMNIDLSVAAFQALGSMDAGELDVEWAGNW
ncbi:barwin-like endoglucanase [Acaromyces ingoldii]|uniref:Barwin-like endoglucanase n=1 Tax=Acaromyces ingoldii TaxID=215250 RepID=A0A316YU38_9BASI|nr:barwin-like endoglucanase [Acaromyces ingoldii]PWN91235.1 barwin-like endoglucanase [Acaromyces ingoldii]